MDRAILNDADREILAREKDHDLFIYNRFICEIARHNQLLTLCGYVYVPKKHPLYGKSDEEVRLSVHGGITYAGARYGYWIFGFDTSHIGDYSPGMVALTNVCLINDIYRNWDYVENEVKSLVRQIEQFGQHNTPNEELAKIILSV